MTAPDTRQTEEAVPTGSDGLRLRIFVHEALRHDHKPLYTAIVELARREGLAGAVVFRGMEGYGLHRHLHTTRLVDLSDDLPIIVEIVDTSEAHPHGRDVSGVLAGPLPRVVDAMQLEEVRAPTLQHRQAAHDDHGVTTYGVPTAQ